MARSTKAGTAVLRLKERTQQAPYSMVSTGSGPFYLVLQENVDHTQQLCAPMEIDDFVQFVNNLHKAPPRKASKLDIAFEEKIQRSKSKTT